MKTRDKIIVAGLIFLLIILHRYLFQMKDGFFDVKSEYSKLKDRLSKELKVYCDVSSKIKEQLKHLYENPPDTDSSEKPEKDFKTFLKKKYKSIYACEDENAKERQTCSIPGPNKTMEYVSCDIYTELPEWSEEDNVGVALSKITSDLPERISRETEWIDVTVKKLKEAVESFKKLKGEGFDGTCSADAAKLRKMLEEAKSCSIPDPATEITRINSLLDNSSLKAALARLESLLPEISKLESDYKKIIDDMEKGGPKKSYSEFKGGDRSKAFIFSMQQNQ
jgi:uncharacterized protein (UPF0335 family)